ncbi:MAG: carboxypeptidase-like regulatory domain-containing protein [Terriglobales bacterium]
MFRGWILIPILALAAAAQPSNTPAQTKFRISGTVVDAVRGGALPDIEVSIGTSQAESLLQTVTTGPDGRFEFDGLPPAKYAMTANARGYGQQGFEEHEGYFTGIVTGPGMASENLQFRLKPESSISGTVTDEFNDPAPLAQVLLFTTGRLDESQMVTLQSQAVVDDAGHFHFGRLKEGKYYLAVYGSPWYAHDPAEEAESDPGERITTDGSDAQSGGSGVEPPRADRPREDRRSEYDVAFPTTYYANASNAEQATPIILKPGDRATADFHLFAVPSAHLKVHSSPSFAKAGASVALLETIFNYSRQAAMQGLGDNATQLGGIAPGQYILRFTANSESQQQPLNLTGDLEVAPSDARKFVSSVTGTVQLEGSSAPCLHCYVQLMNAISGERFGTQVTAQGFEIQGGARPGRYYIELLNSDDYEASTIVASGGRMIGSQLEIAAGAAVRLTITATKALGTIDGIALLDGKPVSQTAVLLLPNNPTHNLILFRRDQSDSDGTFTLRRVLPGDYTVIAVADGWDLEWNDSSVRKAYVGGGVKIHIQPQGGQYQVKVPVQTKHGLSAENLPPQN